MRDRLIELLDEADKEVYEALSLGSLDERLEAVSNINEIKADYLIENGVIVTPCKVGDKVYYSSCGKIYEGVCHAITIHNNSIQVHLYDFDGDNASYSSKKIYTSKEEAEKALKGGDE